MKKHPIALAILLLLALTAFGCTPDAAKAPGASEEPELVLTLEELKQYDGKDGQPAYVAVDGVIYDFSNIPEWKDGEHNGYSAGNDLTEEIKTKSPHGVSRLNGVPVIGKLAEE
ncbi:MAG TPA: cytochrome b5 domain-containing protein [Feifaniaceae bacterium]|nr:cytochrome b5 domain-containing protein [Feifaniaceae bacterium]